MARSHDDAIGARVDQWPHDIFRWLLPIDGNADQFRITAGVHCQSIELLAGFFQVGRGNAIGQPAVRVVDDAFEHVLCRPPEHDRRMRFLRGLWIRAHRWEIEEFAMKLGRVLGPERLHCLERFPCLGPPPREIAAKYLDFLFEPARADTKDEAASTMVIEGSDLLC